MRAGPKGTIEGPALSFAGLPRDRAKHRERFIRGWRSSSPPPPTGPRKYYQFTAIDDCTRLRVLRIYPACNQKTAIQFLDYVLQRLPFQVQAIQTDNGAEFQSAFHYHALDKGIGHSYIKPATPRLNGNSVKTWLGAALARSDPRPRCDHGILRSTLSAGAGAVPSPSRPSRRQHSSCTALSRGDHAPSALRLLLLRHRSPRRNSHLARRYGVKDAPSEGTPRSP